MNSLPLYLLGAHLVRLVTAHLNLPKGGTRQYLQHQRQVRFQVPLTDQIIMLWHQTLVRLP